MIAYAEAQDGSGQFEASFRAVMPVSRSTVTMPRFAGDFSAPQYDRIEVLLADELHAQGYVDALGDWHYERTLFTGEFGGMPRGRFSRAVWTAPADD